LSRSRDLRSSRLGNRTTSRSNKTARTSRSRSRRRASGPACQRRSSGLPGRRSPTALPTSYLSSNHVSFCVRGNHSDILTSRRSRGGSLPVTVVATGFGRGGRGAGMYGAGVKPRRGRGRQGGLSRGSPPLVGGGSGRASPWLVSVTTGCRRSMLVSQ
jgi:hypothetical protein